MAKIIMPGQSAPRLVGNVGDQERVEILNKAVSRLELSQVLAPFTNGVQQHEGLLSFIMERGLKVTMEPDGLRARIDLEELRQFAAEHNMLPRQAAPEPPPS